MIKVIKHLENYGIYIDDKYYIGYTTAQQALDHLNKAFPGFSVEWEINNVLSEIHHYNERLEFLKAHRIRINIDIAVLTQQIIYKCPHPVSEIIEAYDNSGDDKAPYRVCKICGLAEEGWGYGYRLLAPTTLAFNIPKVSCVEGKLFVRKFIFQSNKLPEFSK